MLLLLLKVFFVVNAFADRTEAVILGAFPYRIQLDERTEHNKTADRGDVVTRLPKPPFLCDELRVLLIDPFLTRELRSLPMDKYVRFLSIVQIMKQLLMK